MGAMGSPLENPLEELVDRAGGKPRMVWKVVGTGAGIVGAVAARKALDRIRMRASNRGDVPLNPEDERMSWWYALVWAGVVGVGASLGRVAAQVIVAKVWKRRHRAPVSAMPT
jgi:MFS family permease